MRLPIVIIALKPAPIKTFDTFLRFPADGQIGNPGLDSSGDLFQSPIHRVIACDKARLALQPDRVDSFSPLFTGS